MLRKLGFAIPANLNRSKNENTELAQKLRDNSLSDREAQELLNQVRIWFYDVYTKGENPLLIPIASLTYRLGYHPSLGDISQFIKSARAAGISSGHITKEVKSGPQKGIQDYYFIAAIHKDRVREAFEKDPSLQRFKENPVSQVGGPDAKLPTFWQLRPKQQLFRSPFHIFQELGISWGQYNHFNKGEIFNSDCPVPVFRIRHGNLYYPLDQEETLRVYIQEKLENQSRFPQI